MDLAAGPLELGVIRDARRRCHARRGLLAAAVLVVIAAAGFGAARLTNGGGGLAAAGARVHVRSAAPRTHCARSSGTLLGPAGGYVLIPNAPIGNSRGLVPAALRVMCGAGRAAHP
jgi:hypothetical protein